MNTNRKKNLIVKLAEVMGWERGDLRAELVEPLP
jgi:hypothetical protein